MATTHRIQNTTNCLILGRITFLWYTCQMQNQQVSLPIYRKIKETSTDTHRNTAGLRTNGQYSPQRDTACTKRHCSVANYSATTCVQHQNLTRRRVTNNTNMHISVKTTNYRVISTHLNNIRTMRNSTNEWKHFWYQICQGLLKPGHTKTNRGV
jgi:hypothetical protein